MAPRSNHSPTPLWSTPLRLLFSTKLQLLLCKLFSVFIEAFSKKRFQPSLLLGNIAFDPLPTHLRSLLYLWHTALINVVSLSYISCSSVFVEAQKSSAFSDDSGNIAVCSPPAKPSQLALYLLSLSFHQLLTCSNRSSSRWDATYAPRPCLPAKKLSTLHLSRKLLKQVGLTKNSSPAAHHLDCYFNTSRIIKLHHHCGLPAQHLLFFVIDDASTVAKLFRKAFLVVFCQNTAVCQDPQPTNISCHFQCCCIATLLPSACTPSPQYL